MLRKHQQEEESSLCAMCLQEFGLAGVLISEMGLETVVKLEAAAKPGQALNIRCLSVDMGVGEYRLIAELAKA